MHGLVARAFCVFAGIALCEGEEYALPRRIGRVLYWLVLSMIDARAQSRNRRTGTLFASLAVLSACVLTSTPASAEESNSYAIIIGISQYREEVVPKVKYAVQDAEAIAGVLSVQGGIPPQNIRLLIDSKATGSDLRTISEWLRVRTKTNSKVYVYFAGHGTPNLHTGEPYLVPWDGHPDYLSTLYSVKELYAALNALPARDIVVILDSCFSGYAGRSVLPMGARPMVLSVENVLASGGKVLVLAAAAGNEISSDYEKGRHGLFTAFVLAGLEGGADINHDEVVTLGELFAFVKDGVSVTALRELNRTQTPTLIPAEDLLGERSKLVMANLQGESQLVLERRRLEQDRRRLQLDKNAIEKEKLAAERERLEGERQKIELERKQLAERRPSDGHSSRVPLPPALVSPSILYNSAYNDYLNGRYEMSIRGFEQFLAEFPSTTLAPNAHYWMGESWIAMNEAKKAMTEFELIVHEYKNSDKVAPALFKLGIIKQEMGDLEGAKSYYKELVFRFSASNEARLAKWKLENIKP